MMLRLRVQRMMPVMPVVAVMAVLMLVASGCGDAGLVKVRGKVTFSDDGSPLTRGVVCFDNDKTMARGTIRSDGTYAIGQGDDGRGIAPGSYKVSIFFAHEMIPGGTLHEPLFRELIDKKYSSKDASGLEIVADPSKTQFDIEVDRPNSK